MECPNCNAEHAASDLWCACGYDFRLKAVTESEEARRSKGIWQRFASALSQKRFIDEEGFVRKSPMHSMGIYFLTTAVISLSCMGGAIYMAVLGTLHALGLVPQVPQDVNIGIAIPLLLLALLPNFYLYNQFKVMVSYDVNTWRYAGRPSLRLRMIFLFAGPVGVMAYERMKQKERAFLRTHMASERQPAYERPSTQNTT